MSRFWQKVEMRGHADCWPWMAGKIRNGYGHFSVRGKSVKAHRFAWELYKGRIPDGLFVCHKCDNPSCVNPGHLFLGTPADNMIDKAMKGRATRMAGEENPQAKLTAADVHSIRRLYESGRTQKSIGRLFGVDRRHIGLIVRGKSWGHLS